MKHKIREHVEYLFQTAPKTAQAVEMREELILNLEERFQDLVNQGQPEDAAFSEIINSIGDINELFEGLNPPSPEPVSIPVADSRQKSAQRTAIAVGLLVAGFGFPVFLSNWYSYRIGFMLMMLCWAGAAALLVYNHLNKPSQPKRNATVVEDFREWQDSRSRKEAFARTVTQTICALVVPFYLFIGLFLHLWHPGWLIFPLTPAICMVARTVILGPNNL